MPFSPKQPASMLGTFGFVLFATMVKEATEDYSRYKSDVKANNKQTDLFDYRAGEFVTSKWREVKQGQLVKVKKDGAFPVDMLLIASSNEDGVVFVDTANLDGETNLKDKMEPIPGMNEEKAVSMKGNLYCDKPNHVLDEWDAEIVSPSLEKNLILDVKSLLLRDTILRNTDWVIGIAVNLGKETKIMKNQRKVKPKVSNMMRTMNKMLYSVFAFQFCIVVTLATLSYYWRSNNEDHGYLGQEGVSPFDWVIQLLTYQVTFSHMIPISLYVIIEILKMVQAYIINADIELYNHENNQYSKCQNSDLIEEVGQVKFVFSDKTGTLTQNKMELKKCCINQTIYGELEEGEENIEGICASSVARMKDQVMLRGETKDSRATLNFLTALSVCHMVVCDKSDETDEVHYSSSSPDELALVVAAKLAGFELLSRSTQGVRIMNKIDECIQEYNLLCEFPFDSDRKRMSMIVQDSGRYFLFTKGADTVMLPRL